MFNTIYIYLLIYRVKLMYIYVEDYCLYIILNQQY